SVPGCLFDRRLCSQQEVCVQDGLFGQCQESAARDWPYFQVTSPVLQRLQAVLHRLTAQGLSWQDDITQDVISQEMERIPRLPPPPAREPLPPPTLELLAPACLCARPAPWQSHTSTHQTPPLPLEMEQTFPPAWHAHLTPRSSQLLCMAGAWQGGTQPVAALLKHPHSLTLRALDPPWVLGQVVSLESPWGSQPVPELRPSLLPSRSLDFTAGVRLLEILAEHLHLSTTSFINISVVGPALTFQIRQNHQNLSLADVTNQAAMVKSELEAELGLKIVQTGVGQRNEAVPYPHPSHFGDAFHSVLLTFLALACVAGAGIAGAIAVCLRQHAKQRQKDRLAALGPEGSGDSTLEYQELCRQHMATKSLFGRAEAPPAPAENSRVSSVSSQFSDAPQASPSSHSSTPSWCEEPVQSNMDISTGHMILAYMEDHLRNRDRLAKEWQALCAYQAEPSVCAAARSDANLKKNRNPDYVPYDHARIKLKAESNPSRSDFINASPIIEHDPRMPAYIATQGPLSHTIADFWQMVWENGCTVIVMLSPLLEDSVKQCDRYWPDEGSSLYHIYEVNLVSEHIWCEDFLVRSFYLKNVQSQETRTLTQFHFLSWPADGIPTTTRPLLDFRRKVNKCYRGRSCPVIVHCSDGAGRTGTYILIDMVLNRMAKGVKEIDIAATLEHVRDQRPGMVQTKDQFEFALTAVAEEVNAILKALPQ
uniref:Protein tyrosine phosphatase receptor type N n=1 Tax=Gopherus evgoodei TaxID=1825980 RepID=A0A8C4Y399_9SAUR